TKGIVHVSETMFASLLQVFSKILSHIRQQMSCADANYQTKNVSYDGVGHTATVMND
ncbi:unnamed protein product, partial [Allacma fusca]